LIKLFFLNLFNYRYLIQFNLLIIPNFFPTWISLSKPFPFLFEHIINCCKLINHQLYNSTPYIVYLNGLINSLYSIFSSLLNIVFNTISILLLSYSEVNHINNFFNSFDHPISDTKKPVFSYFLLRSTFNQLTYFDNTLPIHFIWKICYILLSIYNRLNLFFSSNYKQKSSNISLRYLNFLFNLTLCFVLFSIILTLLAILSYQYKCN
jgi:hypothetical protein